MKGLIASTYLALHCQREAGEEGEFLTPRLRIHSLHPPCAPSTHTRELKIPFTPTGARSGLEKAEDKKRFSTEQNHHNSPALICSPPQTSPVLPVPIELCHHPTVIHGGKTLRLWMKRSTAIYSRRHFEVSGRSPVLGQNFSKCSPFLFYLPSFSSRLSTKPKWPAKDSVDSRVEHLNVQRHCSFPSFPPSRLSNRGMQRWHVDNKPWGPATSKAWRAPKNTNVRPNGTLH